MKKILFVLFAAGLFACQTADKKSVAALSQEEKDKAAVDTAKFTTIEWLDSTYKDLGQLKKGQEVEISYRFKNAGNKNLIISNVSASCGCTIPEKPEKPIAPGQEDVIKAKFNSTNFQGEVRKEIFITANTAAQSGGTMKLSFRADVTE
jgi:Protein of unknown function (DUF1573)